MPTKEQMATVRAQIEDVISRRYIESDGDMCSCWFQPETAGPIGARVVNGSPAGEPEPFNEIPTKAQVELLTAFVDWEGFDDSQAWGVIQRVMGGERADSWMDEVGYGALKEAVAARVAERDEPDLER